MTGKKKARLRALWLAAGTTFLTSSAALAVPAWYGANGGFVANGPNDAKNNPTLSVPDFFQHQ